jgi:DUF4097 and DUF4098 domain-containing protein YvlB
MTKSLWRLSLVFALLALATAAVVAQDKDKSDKSKFDKKSESSLECREYRDSDRLFGHCEIKEQTLPAGSAITVDGKQNGGISIKGWDRNEILVRAKVETRAPTQAEANVLAQQVRIETATLNIHAEGPESRDDYQWYVSFEIFVPRRSDLSLTAHNGGISIRDVSGRIDFQTLNGGVSLSRVGGAVRGSTTNGGVHIELAGPRWDGEELNVRTTNGGVNLVMPDNYSAHLETSTVNGNVSSDVPLNVPMTSRGRMPKEISVDLGSGGPTIRATTTNGGVRVARASSL